MSVYTKGGDKGKTDLIGKRVSKDDIRIEINGLIDEVLTELAFLIYDINNENQLSIYIEELNYIYKLLFNIQSIIADLNNIIGLSINENDVKELENKIDYYDSDLPKLTHFITYIGHPTAMQGQKVRAKIRTIERRIIELNHQEEVNSNILSYINRLSDYFYILSRKINCIYNIQEKRI
ncbi:cob(I)yrinic acid a,c-diamide adenosyltransferase [Haloplasma contractile]|uniref:Corrinoid adenosyltransferase n=1 Tax=Haloplasma contractile SSD-17B TaxID=1033810 RepID=F7PWJ5_9MOLU|nr:cob(I)yrinic acid a,c-diamide adenosyltransferase [Haloplasma contractile]ERJ12638.1 trans-aconitate 2-methyltransferase protein [Haloplasma contractile SSD-17B]